jgi:agmatinase
MARVIDRIVPGSKCILTIDVDGLDPSVAPGVIVPQPGGLLYDDILDLIDGVTAKARLVGLNLVELVPERDVNGLTALVAGRIVCNAIANATRSKR